MIATRKAYGKALEDLGDKYKNLVVLDADLSKSTKTAFFKEKYPDRFFNMGISEGDMMSTAAGLATCGKTVFASTFAMFAAGRAYEQIRNSICYPNLNVKIAATHAGISIGEDGASHQCIEDIALMRVIPNMTVISPCDDIETKEAVKAAINHNGPVYLRLARLKSETVNEDDYNFELGKGVTLKEGNDLTIITTGLMVDKCLKVADMLKEKEIDARVINIHTIKPIDENIIVNAAKETGNIVTVEEHNIYGGLGSAVSEVTSEKYPVKVKKIGVKDKFGTSGKPKDILKKYKLDENGIYKQIMEDYIED